MFNITIALANDNFIFGNADARTFGFIIFIKNKYEYDQALIKHELEHVRQFWTAKWFRSKCWRESRAYREQYRYDLKHYRNIHYNFYIDMINKYCEDCTRDNIIKFLQKDD